MTKSCLLGTECDTPTGEHCAERGCDHYQRRVLRTEDEPYPVFHRVDGRIVSPPLAPDAETWSRGDWLQTFSGRAFYPADPRPEDICVEDIAAALSKLCRYGGHCLRFYSVAEHCVHVAAAAPEGLKLDALMHDATEGYLVDVPRPIKRQLPDYQAIEERIERIVADRFGLQYPHPPEVKALDNAILVDEYAQNMARAPLSWGFAERTGLGVRLQFWTPERAAAEFMTAFYRYGGHERAICVDSKQNK